jgi:hypothetical protein
MKAREEMPLLRCALGPTGRPFGDGLHSVTASETDLIECRGVKVFSSNYELYGDMSARVTASETDGRKAVITRNWDMAGSTLKKPIRGRKMGVGAVLPGLTEPDQSEVASLTPTQWKKRQPQAD